MTFKKIVLAVLAVAVLASPAHAGRNKMEKLPAPTLREPGDNVRFKAADGLLFRWSSEGDRSTLRYFDFRLYKGAQAYESGLVLKKEVPAGETSITVPGELFEAGQTYAWTVRQMGGSKRSMNAYSVFKVDEKN